MEGNNACIWTHTDRLPIYTDEKFTVQRIGLNPSFEFVSSLLKFPQ